MAESTLSLSRADIRKRIAEYAGYGRDDTAWSTDQTDKIDGILDSGLRQFYFPPPTRGFPNGYQWRFLKPVATITLWGSIASGTATVTGSAYDGTSSTLTASSGVFYPSMIGKTVVITGDGAGSYVIDGYTSSTVISVTGDASAASASAFSLAADGTYRLPDDFGGIQGDRFSFAYNESWVPVKRVGDSRIRELYMDSNTTGRPQFIAIRPVAGFDGTTGQRWELNVWPLCDTTYTMSYPKIILADALTASADYPYGGAAHAETIMESCLAAAEIRLNDEIGIHNQLFQRQLEQSINVDKRLGSSWLGYNGDRSSRDSLELSRVTQVTVDGVFYE